MMKVFLVTLFTALVFLGNASNASAQGVNYIKFGTSPVFEDTGVNHTIVKSLLTDIDDQTKQPIRYPHPTLGGNKYWMAYANLGSGGQIRYAYSDDLLVWKRFENNPVLSFGGGELYLSSPNLFKQGNLYYLFYDVGIQTGSNTETQRLSYASSPTPFGPWTKGPYILDTGALGEWDHGRVTEPGIFKDGDTYYLFYMGDSYPPNGNGEQVAVATTTAVNFPAGPWVKRGLMLPIGQSTTAWDRGLTADPNIIKVGNTFYMLYTGSYGNENWKMGIATANNLLGPWTRPSTPILTPGPSQWDNGLLVRGGLYYNLGKFYLYYSGYSGSTGRFKVGLAVGDPLATPVPFQQGTILVNAGGPNNTDFGFVGGQTYSVTNNITGTTDPSLYQTERYGMSEYGFVVPNGSYNVTLKFAEIYSGCYYKSCRVFNVDIEGNRVLSNFDIFAEVGSYKALDKTFTVAVNDGKLDINFGAIANNPKISAIKIVPNGTTTPTPTPSAIVTPTPTPTASPSPASAILVNAGGPMNTDFGFVGGQTYTVINNISGTADQLLYQSERFGMTGYGFNVNNGTYIVTLKFAEIYSGCYYKGCRVFNVDIEGKRVLTNFDILAEAGGAFKALDKTYTVTVNDGKLNINFGAITNNPKISAIKIVPSLF